VKIRRAELDDAEAIRAIYNPQVESSTVTFDLVPRSMAEQQAWIRARTGAHAALVAEIDGAIVGFGSLSAYRDRPGYATTVEDSVYVAPDRQGLGVGGALLAALVETARDHGFHAIMARVVGGHEASIALHLTADFDVVGTEREVGRKLGRWLDVVLLQRLL
jgi:phosphinothricin acetyltransferase